MAAAAPDTSCQTQPESNILASSLSTLELEKPKKSAEATDPPPNPQDHGWVKKEALDYETINMSHQQFAENGLDKEWAGAQPKYEWVDEFGDVAPRDLELEEHLFKNSNRPEAGKWLKELNNYKVLQESETRFMPIREFSEAALHPVMVENIKLCGYSGPTPVQAYVIAGAIHGKDVLAVAQTGSGKTAAYLIPILSVLMGKAKKLTKPKPNQMTYDPATDGIRAEPLVLIMCPTRELALQNYDEARRLCYRSMLRPCVTYGGGPRLGQLADLRRGCDILIATPGRLKDFISNETGSLSLERVKHTVMDEADAMMSEQWEEETRLIFHGATGLRINDDHQMFFFSATFDKNARNAAKDYMADDHIRIRVGRAGSSHLNIHQIVVWVEDSLKKKALSDLLNAMPPCRTLIFVNSKQRCDEIDDYLYNMDFPCVSITGDRTQREREDAVRKFKAGTVPIMIASGLLSRGFDVKRIMHVIQYDLPSTAQGGIDEYVHRIGRTARIGNRGQATSFFNDRNEDLGPALARTLVECNHEVPEFLKQYEPEDGQALDFDDDSDEEDDDERTVTGGGVDLGDAWGSGPAADADFTATWSSDSGAATTTSSWA